MIIVTKLMSSTMRDLVVEGTPSGSLGAIPVSFLWIASLSGFPRSIIRIYLFDRILVDR